MRKLFFSIFIIFLSYVFLVPVKKRETSRTYSEVATEAPQTMAMADATADPHAGLNLNVPAAMMGSTAGADPHAGFTKEQLNQMLQESLGQQISTNNASPLSWTVPDGWQEKPATGMRIATFVQANDDKAIDCSIVALGAGAGGLTPNIIRWLGQLDISSPADNELADFINQQEKITLDDNHSALIIDFTGLQSDAPAATPSMLAAIIETPDQRIFVKMMGNKQKIVEQAQAFHNLVQSLKFNR